MSDTIFDYITELPSLAIDEKSKGLIGFDGRFERVEGNLRLLLDRDGLEKWRNTHYGNGLALVDQVLDRYPLIILAGDVGTGKTASAECFANQMVRVLGKTGYFMRLSTRVRGQGMHGEMGNLVNDAFARAKQEAGKKRMVFLLIDEADAIATTRGTAQMHQEEKAGVNTLIQKIDELRDLKGRVVLLMSTNRLHFLDEAIVRRAAIVMEFNRPDDAERKALFQHDLVGLSLSEDEIDQLVKLTGPNEINGKVGHSFSDLRLRLMPEALAKAYPNDKLKMEHLVEAALQVKPSPPIQ